MGGVEDEEAMPLSQFTGMVAGRIRARLGVLLNAHEAAVMMRGSGFAVVKWNLSGRFRPQLGHTVGPGDWSLHSRMCQLILLCGGF